MRKKSTTVSSNLIDTPDVRQLAAPVSQKVQIQGVALISFSANRDPEFDPRKQKIRVIHDTNTQRRGPNLAVLLNVEVRTEREGEQSGFQLSASFLLTYTLTDDTIFADENLKAFGDLNGVFNAWPYVREFVQSSSTRMGLGPLTLPVFRPPTNDTQASSVQATSKPKPRLTKKSSPKKH